MHWKSKNKKTQKNKNNFGISKSSCALYPMPISLSAGNNVYFLPPLCFFSWLQLRFSHLLLRFSERNAFSYISLCPSFLPFFNPSVNSKPTKTSADLLRHTSIKIPAKSESCLVHPIQALQSTEACGSLGLLVAQFTVHCPWSTLLWGLGSPPAACWDKCVLLVVEPLR